MFHFFEAITNTKGDALTGYCVKVIDATSGDTVSIYSDNVGTPISNVSGIADTAVVDGDGNVSFYVEQGTYHLDIYTKDSTTFVRRVRDIPMGISSITLAAGSSVDSRAHIAAIANPVANQSAILTESGREGMFVFSTDDLSAQVTADPLQGIYVPPSADATGASGAWVRKYEGLPLASFFGAVGDGTTDDTAAVNTAVTIISALGINALKFDEGKTFVMSAQTTFGAANLEIEGFGSTIKNTFDGRAFSFSGNGVRCRGLALYQAATGTDPAPYAEVSGANVVIEECIFTRDATSHIPFYVRATATGFRFRNNSCTWYGGINLISNVNDVEISGSSFINPVGGASDDGIAIKAIGGTSRNIRIHYNFFNGMADFVGIGSEIGVSAATDPTYSSMVEGVSILGNHGINCQRMVFIKPGAVDGVDYRDGTVRGVTISDNTLIDTTGAAMLQPFWFSAGRGARIIGVSGKNNKAIGRCKSGGVNPRGMWLYVRNDGTGTADALIDNIDVGLEVHDPFNGVANGILVNGVAAPGVPFDDGFYAEKVDAAHGTMTRIVCDMTINGTARSGVSVQAGLDDAVHVRRLRGTNLCVGNVTGTGGISASSRMTVGTEIVMERASSRYPYQINTGGSVTCADLVEDVVLFPADVPAGTAATSYPCAAKRRSQLVGAKLGTTNTPTPNDTNYTTLLLKNKSGTDVQFALARTKVTPNGGNDIAMAPVAGLRVPIFDWASLTLNSQRDQTLFAEGQTVHIDKTDAGTGAALNGSRVSLAWLPY